MALLLRFGGVPARVAAGFSPGGFRSRQDEWVIRDRDAHSWVEAWFDGIGWVTFDPTPSATPARSLIAAINEPEPARAASASANDAATAQPGTRNPAGARRELDPGTAQNGSGAAAAGGPSPWLYVGAGVAALALLASILLLIRRRRRGEPLPPADRAIADLVTALRRAGRPVPPGMTLIELERRLGGSRDADSYLAALRAARYGSAQTVPTRDQRRAFRRELAAGLGWRGRIRSWWALPPQLR